MESLINDLSQLDGQLESFEPSLTAGSRYYTSDDFQNNFADKLHSNCFTLLNVNARSLIKHFSDYDLYLNSLQSPNFHGY
jgi:hypothetical protein